MYAILREFAQLLILISGILLLVGGLSEKEKFTSNKPLQKRMLMYGIVIVVLSLIISIPDMYNGILDGWNSNR